MTRICLWSGPRNVSTALMYSFAQRSDTVVADEPLYAHYLRVTDAGHPGQAEILRSQNPDGAQVVQQVLLGAYARPVVFFKHMAHHLVDLDEGFLAQMRNVLLIRHPAEVIASFSKVIAQPVLRDIGIARQAALLETLDRMGLPAVIVDGSDLLRDPARMLEALCHALDLPFEPAMLHWPPGPRPEDGIWAPYWYAQVHRSSGFEPWKPHPRQVPPHLQPLLEEAMTHYGRVYARALRTG